MYPQTNSRSTKNWSRRFRTSSAQKEYVDVPDTLLSKTAELARHFAVSHAYVAALEPKPTTRKPAAGKAKAKPASKQPKR